MSTHFDECPDRVTLASFYADERGWRVFPCHSVRAGRCTCGKESCASPGKHPLIDRWPEQATCDPRQVDNWWRERPNANVAIATGDGLAVVDVDPRNGGFETLAQLEKKFGRLPRDFVVATGGGGLHIYFAVPAGLKSCKKWAHEGVEILCEGAYVIAPPSSHYAGAVYGWPKGLPTAELPMMPSGWLKTIPKVASKTRADQTTTPSQSSHRTANQTDSISFIPSYLSDLDWEPATCRQVEAAIDLCCVTTCGTRNHQLLSLGRRLKCIGTVGECDAESLEPVVREWFRRSKPAMRTKEWRVSWGEWLNIWLWADPVRCAESAATYAYQAAENSDVPSCALRYKVRAMRMLVAVCKAMHDASEPEGGVFFLSCRTAAGLLKITVYQANSWLNRLVRDGILEKVDLHKPGSLKAQRYRYIGDAPCGASQAA